MTTTIIGLVGPAGSGKSSAAAFLAEHYGARRYSFANPLKDMVRAAFDLTEEQVHGTQAQKEAVDPRYGVSPRWILQRVGTEGCRGTFGTDFWSRMLLERIQRDRPELAVVEDVRFVDEAAAIRQPVTRTDARIGASYTQIGYVWRLHPVPGARQSSDAGTHASETEWLRCRADAEVCPAALGLPELHARIAHAAAACSVRPAVPL